LEKDEELEGGKMKNTVIGGLQQFCVSHSHELSAAADTHARMADEFIRRAIEQPGREACYFGIAEFHIDRAAELASNADKQRVAVRVAAK